MRHVRTIRAFFRREDIAQSLAALGECVGGLGKIVIVGGALRELTLAELCSATPDIPDIDVAVVADFDPNEVIRRLGPRACTVNSFGGIKWQTDGSLPLDIWSARAWAERIGKVSRSEYRVEEIKGFLDFNVNAREFTRRIAMKLMLKTYAKPLRAAHLNYTIHWSHPIQFNLPAL